MCGIAFVLNYKNDNLHNKIIKDLTLDQTHRGPDSNNIFIDENFALGHTRLSIMDLSKNGEQPFTDASKNFLLIYNGEIYNSEELKKKLQKKNIQYKSFTDTEVVLYSLIYFGEDIIKDFNGMFSFIFIDRIQKKAIIGRDRYGIKPLYYTLFDKKLIFTSEIKPIINVEGFKTKVNENVISEYFTFQNIFTNDTFFKNITSFPPASYSILNLGSKNIENLKINEYWDYEFENKNDFNSLDDATDAFESIFKDVIKRQSNSMVEVNSYLSGGVDSSLISLYLKKINQNLNTFSCGFNVNNNDSKQVQFDESDQALSFSNKIGSKHHQIYVNHGDLELYLDDLVYTLENPIMGQSYPNFIVSKFASAKTKVICSGTGGDELFAGYGWRYIFPENDISNEDYLNFYYRKWQRLTTSSELTKIFKPSFLNIDESYNKKIMFDLLNKKNFDKDFEGFINKSLYFESKTFLKGLLSVEDRISMKFGMETRVPFLDNKIVDFALSLPIRFKISDKNSIVKLDENLLNKKYSYISSGNLSKILLRNLLKINSIEDVSKRNKQGFTAPDEIWYRNQSLPFIKNTLINDNDAPIFNFFDRKTINKIVHEHIDNKKNNRLLIWSFLVFNSWIKQFI